LKLRKPKLSLMKFKIGILAIASLVALTACNSGAEKTETDAESDMSPDTLMAEPAQSADMMEKDGIKIMAYTASPTFENASLKSISPKNGEKLKPGNIKFDYDVQGYELRAQTTDAGSNGLANSDKGQHIHAILNNEPYMAEYLPGFEKELKQGRYILLSFLSRSYHESVKNPAAMDLIQFTVGDVKDEPADLKAPHIFYSRPKGSYKGADTKKLLLDFYLANCNLSADGYKVRATLNGTEFMLTNWSAYVVEGLPMGDVEVKLELIDSNGQTVQSPFNPSTRTVTLEE